MKELQMQLREALAAGRFAEAGPLLEEYRKRFDETWAAMPEPDRRNSPLLRETVELMRWALPVTVVTRAAVCEQRRVLRAGSNYRRGKGEHRTWQWKA